MAQIPSGGSQVEPHDNLYTVMLIVSAAVLLIGIVFMIVRSIQLFGSIWPAGSSAT